MISDKEALTKFLTAIMVDIKLTQMDKGIIASGRSAASLKVVVTEGQNFTAAGLTGEGYFHFQDQGRKPGALPNVQAIEEWIKVKGLDLNPWAVAKSIAKKGTVIFRDRNKGLQLDKIVMANKAFFLEELAGNLSKQVISSIKQTFIRFN